MQAQAQASPPPPIYLLRQDGLGEINGHLVCLHGPVEAAAPAAVAQKQSGGHLHLTGGYEMGGWGSERWRCLSLSRLLWVQHTSTAVTQGRGPTRRAGEDGGGRTRGGGGSAQEATAVGHTDWPSDGKEGRESAGGTCVHGVRASSPPGSACPPSSPAPSLPRTFQSRARRKRSSVASVRSS